VVTRLVSSGPLLLAEYLPSHIHIVPDVYPYCLSPLPVPPSMMETG